MKLLYCCACGDVVALRREVRECSCGASRGKYLDRLNAEMEGPCLCLGFANGDFKRVVSEQFEAGDLTEEMPGNLYRGQVKGRVFTAFVIPESAASVKRMDDGRGFSLNRRGT